jgi:hypothetical protein
MLVRIPAVTLDVDVDAWVDEYGVESEKVPADVIRYFIHQLSGPPPIDEGWTKIRKVHYTKASPKPS